MLRRSHKKSKHGCRECKRRHVKCDEARPACRLCVLSDRSCTYTTLTPPSPPKDTQSASSTPSHSTPPRPGTPSGPHNGAFNPPNRPNLPEGLASSERSHGLACPSTTPTGEVNVDHVQLIAHLYSCKEIYVLADKVQDHEWGIRFAMETGLRYPYLLHAMMGFSACHLAHQNPTQSKYEHYAIDLQTRAVTLFNASGPDITPENCVPMLLFSTILGQHLFADVLRPRDFAGLQPFVKRFTHCLGLQKGIAVIFHAARPVLMASPLESLLTQGMEAQHQRPVGTECAELSAMVQESTTLTSEQKGDFMHSVWILQLGFDAMAQNPDEPTHLCYKWVLAVRPGLMKLLEDLNPEALMVLAYYALLLHLNRKAWLVGSAGAYILSMVREHLGPEWSPLLAYPRRRMAEEC